MFRQIEGLVYMPNCDLPFGKTMRMGTQDVTIYERVIEHGYRAGIQAHGAHLETQGELEALTDTQFTALLDTCVPSGLSPKNKELWRAYFIVGWTCVHLCLVPLE